MAVSLPPSIVEHEHGSGGGSGDGFPTDLVEMLRECLSLMQSVSQCNIVNKFYNKTIIYHLIWFGEYIHKQTMWFNL